jgi:cyclohexanecarboxyl-CoA dehydrogenase
VTITLSEEQRAFRAAAERFARDKLAPHYQARERAAAIDRKLVRDMGALGLIGTDLPERHGGLGLPSETCPSRKSHPGGFAQ